MRRLSDEDAAYLKQTCEQSGVTISVTDRETLAQLAALLRTEGSEAANPHPQDSIDLDRRDGKLAS
ncbi:MAG: hypothetical protein ACRDTT_30220 [Pseudonocardiaceae bacterium]